jgi:hypothetical protein
MREFVQERMMLQDLEIFRDIRDFHILITWDEGYHDG